MKTSFMVITGITCAIAGGIVTYQLLPPEAEAVPEKTQDGLLVDDEETDPIKRCLTPNAGEYYRLGDVTIGGYQIYAYKVKTDKKFHVDHQKTDHMHGNTPKFKGVAVDFALIRHDPTQGCIPEYSVSSLSDVGFTTTQLTKDQKDNIARLKWTWLGSKLEEVGSALQSYVDTTVGIGPGKRTLGVHDITALHELKIKLPKHYREGLTDEQRTKEFYEAGQKGQPTEIPYRKLEE